MANYTFYRANDYSRIGLERVYAYFDHFHDIASEGHMREVTNMAPAEAIEYLTEVIYTLEETVQEINKHEARLSDFETGTVDNTQDHEEVEQ